MSISRDTLDNHIPYYLTAEQKQGLMKALSDFGKNTHNYYINSRMDETLQGDGWSGFDIIRLEDGQRNKIKGIILSNSCDISQENKRDIDSRIVFAPIIKLSSYVALLKQNGLQEEQIESKLQSIRQQKITTLFYLPPFDTDEEWIAKLDDLRSIPAKLLSQSDSGNKEFTLSMFGFYLFVFKISIHFCRFHEDIIREDSPQPAG